MTEPWYPFYVGDYARKTAHLSLLEHGAYRLLIDHYMATRSPLPNDPAKLYRICRARTPSERQAVLSVTAEFFVEDGSLLRHEKCDSELCKQLKYKESQSAKAKLRHSHGTAAGPIRARNPQPQPQKKEGKPSSSSPYPQLPDWIQPDLWDAFREMRKGKRDPMTARAEQLILRELEKLQQQGHDPIAVLEQSIRNGWKDVYPLKGKGNEDTYRGSNGKPAHTGSARQPTPSKDERARAAVMRAAESGGFAPEG